MNDNIYPLTLYYDSRCATCMAEIRNLMLRNQDGQLVFADIWADDMTPPPGYSREMLLSRLHAQQADGTVIHSLEAFRRIYAAVGMDWVGAVTRWPLIGRLGDWVYPIFARHRHRVPRIVIRFLFEYPARRAARRFQRNRCDLGGSCRL